MGEQSSQVCGKRILGRRAVRGTKAAAYSEYLINKEFSGRRRLVRGEVIS